MGTKEYVEGGFGYGESEYEISFDLAPRSGELWPSGPETPEPFNFPSRARNGVHIRAPRKIWNLRVKAWGPGHINPEIKGRWLNLHFFFDFRGGEFTFF